MCVPGPGMGVTQHEDLSVGQRVLPQSGGGMWWRDCPFCRHQEHEEVSQLPWIRPLPQSGTSSLVSK